MTQVNWADYIIPAEYTQYRRIDIMAVLFFPVVNVRLYITLYEIGCSKCIWFLLNCVCIIKNNNKYTEYKIYKHCM